MQDKKIFHDAAWYYARFRRGYPKSFYKHITDIFKLNNESHALDLGTGTGQIAIPISKIVKEVVAVDPEKNMLKEGEIIAQKDNISNISWININAEDISKDLGLFDVTTMGASFHWMEQDDVLKKIYNLTNNGGGVTLTLPVTAAIGDAIQIVGKSGDWVLAQNASQQVFLGNSSTTVGVGGSLTATDGGDCIEIICITANDEWRVADSVGNIIIV